MSSAAPPGSDPSMDDILASIRRILDEDPPAEAPGAAAEIGGGASELVLDASMLASPEGAPAAASEAVRMEMPAAASVPEPAPLPVALPAGFRAGVASAALLNPAVVDQTASSMASLVQAVTERGTAVHRGGPTIEELVRAELRPLLKAWLDAHLPALVERVVRGEIERVVSRALP